MGADENVGFIILGVVLVIFLVVIGLILWIILRRRRRNLKKVSETWMLNFQRRDKGGEYFEYTLPEKYANETRKYRFANINCNYLDDSTPDKYFSSIVEGRPTSVLINSLGIDTYDQGIFCYNTIGPEGGMLKISGVTLKIPKHAIAEPTRFTLGVIWDENLRPKLTNKQALLSPIVICQPSLKFKLPVKLSFPHCAVNVSENWKLKIFMKEGDIGETSDWKAIDDDDTVKIHVTLSHVNLELHHFTLYTCVGEGVVDKIAAKSVKLVAFTSRLQIGSPYKARIYCINDYKKEMEDLEDIEKRLEGKMADANVPLFIHDDGGNISVTSSYISENWNLIGNKTEEMDFELVWHALTPSCTFIFKPGKSTMKEIICEFESLQVTQKNKTAKLKVADHFEQVCQPVINLNGNVYIITYDKSFVAAFTSQTKENDVRYLLLVMAAISLCHLTTLDK